MTRTIGRPLVLRSNCSVHVRIWPSTPSFSEGYKFASRALGSRHLGRSRDGTGSRVSAPGGIAAGSPTRCRSHVGNRSERIRGTYTVKTIMRIQKATDSGRDGAGGAIQGVTLLETTDRQRPRGAGRASPCGQEPADGTGRTKAKGALCKIARRGNLGATNVSANQIAIPGMSSATNSH